MANTTSGLQGGAPDECEAEGLPLGSSATSSGPDDSPGEEELLSLEPDPDPDPDPEDVSRTEVEPDPELKGSLVLMLSPSLVLMSLLPEVASRLDHSRTRLWPAGLSDSRGPWAAASPIDPPPSRPIDFTATAPGGVSSPLDDSSEP